MQPRDLDREAAGVDDAPERLPLDGRGVVQHERDRLTPAVDRQLPATVARVRADGSSLRVHVLPALGQEEAQLEARITNELAQQGLDLLGCRPPGP